MTGDERLAKVAEVLAGHNFGRGWCAACGALWYDTEHQHIPAHVARALKPLLDEFRAEDEARVLRALLASRVVCPVHGISDCGPLLNGCQIPRYIAEWRGEFLADLRAALAATEPDAGER